MSIKVKVGGSRSIRAVPKQGTNRSLVALGEKKPLITPDSVVLGIDTLGAYVATANAGAGIVITPDTHTETAKILIRHANTSNELPSTNNNSLEYIRNINIDNFGHIVGFSNQSYNTDYFTSANSIVNIIDAEADGATKGIATFNSTNFNSLNGVISSADMTFGNTALTLGESTNAIEGLTSLGVGELTFVQGRIIGTDDILISPTTGGVVDVDGHRVVNISNPIDNQDAVTLSWLDQELDALTISLRVIADPTDPTDATNKRYVDNVLQGLRVRPSMLAATTADLGGTYAAGNTTINSTITLPAALTITIDDVTNWDIGSRLLVKDQTNPEENGAYEVTQLGDASTDWIFTRTDFSNESSEIPGSFHFITDGTTYRGTGWVAIVDDAETFQITVDDINYTQFQGEGTFTAGVGLTLNGTQFNVNESQILETINTANNNLNIIGTGALKIPVGTTANRPISVQGQIRYNTTDGQFEGYDGTAWSGLGGVIDVDQDTKITAENSPGSDNDQLRFYTAGTERLTVDAQSIVANVDLIIDTTGALTIPNGSTGDRPTAEQGMIRFNTSDGQFEGYDGTAWAGLGGVIDVDQDTKITAENSPGSDNDQLKFFTGGTLAAMISAANTAYFYDDVNVTGDLTANNAAFSGNVTIGGNITIGDQTTDSITVVADFDSNLVANSHNSFDLGKSGVDWRTLYVQNIQGQGEVVTFNMNGAITIPVGTTAQRPSGNTAAEGMIRYNTTDSRFESYDGSLWGGLAGSVIDVNRDTYIIAEETAGANNDELWFYTANTEAFIVSNTQVLTTRSGDLKLDAASGEIDIGGSSVKNGGNLLRIKETVFTGAGRAINLFNEPTITLGRGLEEINYDAANNEIEFRLTGFPSTLQPGTYGNDGYTPRIIVDDTGRITFATDIPVELQANAIPDFTETSRDIIALMFVGGNHSGITVTNDDANNVINLAIADYNLDITGAVTGSVNITGVNTSITTIADGFDYLRTVTAGNGIDITHTLGANTTATITHGNTSDHPSINNSGGFVIQDLTLDEFGHITTSNSIDMDLRYLELAGGGDVIGNISSNSYMYARRFIDYDDNVYYLDPNGTSRINLLEIGYNQATSQLSMGGSLGTAYLWTNGRNVGFLDSVFAYAAYADIQTGDWIVPNGDVKAERFIDADATTYFLHPGGTDSLIKHLEIETNLDVGTALDVGTDLTVGASGDIGTTLSVGTSIDVGFLTISGSTIASTGSLTLAASGNIGANSQKIIDVADPTAAQDAATKAYVDAVAQGLKIVPSALVATTQDLGATYNHSAGTLTANTAGVLTIDGVQPDVGDRILVKDQTNAEENGSYEVTNKGNFFNSFVLTRGSYFNESAEIPGSFQFVTDGTTNNGTGWVAQVTDAETFALGTDDVNWYQFSGAGTYSGGDGLTLTGTEFSVNVDDSTIEINTDILRVKDAGVTNAKLANPNFTISGEAGANTSIALGETLIFEAGEGVNTSISAGKVTIASELATDTNIGAAAFSNTNFDVTAGTVTVTDIDGGSF